MSEIHTEPSGYTWHWHGDLIKVYRPDGTFAGRVYRDSGPRGTFYRAETGTDPCRVDWKRDREVTRHRASVSEAVAALAYPPPPAPVYRVTRGMGETVAPGGVVHDRQGAALTFLRATAATLPGLAGKVIVSRDGREHELSARVFRLTVTRVIPTHADPATGAWCPFSGVSQSEGRCPVHTPDTAA